MLPEADISYLHATMVANNLIRSRIMFEVVQGMRLHRTLNYCIKIVGMSVKPIFTMLFSKQFESGTFSLESLVMKIL